MSINQSSMKSGSKDASAQSRLSISLKGINTLASYLVAITLLVASGVAHAENFAGKQLKITAPAAPGGGWDSSARSLQQVMLSTKMVPSVQVINIPGAGGTVGLAQFANGAKNDPNQVLMMGVTMVGAIISNKAPLGLDGITPIARLTEDPLVIVVPANSKYKTVGELASDLKTDTSTVVWAGGSAGGADHILAGLLTKAAGGNPGKLNYVPFSGGGEALAEMLGGRVSAGISGYNEFESQIKAGNLRALAVSTETRIAGVNVPTLKESGFEVVFTNWRGLVAGKGISEKQQLALSELAKRTMETSDWKAILKARGWEDAYLDAQGFEHFLKEEQVRVHDALKSIGLAQ